ncbi:hypothetical protein GGD56_006758 [Rhizobium mongolense]|nr:hypothetical protein [Rhizobium mongolense]MBB4232859.1 hypothetical protein [Rhizobium mongolense]
MAAIGDGLQFRKARDAAQFSTGRKQPLGISKRGSRYVRKLWCMALGGVSDISTGRAIGWGVGSTALKLGCILTKPSSHWAAKMARIVWAVLNKPGALHERRDPAFA